jgi:uncharacterized protein (TIGR03083 family)
MTERLDTDQVWQAVDAQRLALVAELERLTDAEWRTPSLCAGWTVRDVAAHLTLQQVRGPGDGVTEFLRHPGGMNRMIREAARSRARRPTADLIAGIRAGVGTRRHNLGLTPRETLIDALVHSQDITVPLGRPLPLAPDAAAEAATRVWERGWPWHPRRRFAGFRLAATDVDWSVGAGTPVEGPIDALLMLLTGRPTELTVARAPLPQAEVGSSPVR